MAVLSQDVVVSLEFTIDWKSGTGKHQERYFAKKVNFWRDILPVEPGDLLSAQGAGEELTLSFSSEEQSSDRDEIITLKREQFECPKIDDYIVEPRFGRFYPKGLLQGVENIFKGNAEPFRCVRETSTTLAADLNHPFASRAFNLTLSTRNVRKKAFEIGGAMTDWMDVVTQGPGMQVRWEDRPTDFFSDVPFRRSDESKDSRFYKEPRFVTHLDDRALTHIRTIYGNVLRPGMKVLDLMSSWQSHVPETMRLDALIGLGLNEEEMSNNPHLSSYVVHDLNENAQLPFDDGDFDAIICTSSVEYMTQPLEVFADCARILKPNGLLIHTFSNRWFPPKVVGIWSEISEFERMGLVLEYLLQSGRYQELETHSFRGWPRPADDRYYPRVRISDPVFAVSGRRTPD